jgi:UDP-N-acetylglucosamine acyltransferase
MISPLAYIHPDARLAPGVTIEPFTTIAADVEIGEGTWIGPNVTIMNGARIGRHCQVFPGAVIAGVPQDLKFAGEKTTAVIGDHTVIRECVTVNRGTNDRWETRVGSHCLLMAYVHIAHDCIIGNHCILANTVQVAGHVEIGDYAIVGGSSAVHQFVKIGTHAMVSGGSLVRKDVPPYVKAGREPLTYAGVNSVGLRRRGFSDEAIQQTQQLYRTLFLGGLNTQDALAQITQDLPATTERDTALDFVRAATRGIIKGPKRGRTEAEAE